jgi:hypothetical protein
MDKNLIVLADKYRSGIIDGYKLAEMLKNNEITKSERRKIVKLASSNRKRLLTSYKIVG